MSTIQFIKKRININKFCQEERISYLGLFGSSARGEATPSSDIDLLIDFQDGATLFKIAKIKLDLEDKLEKEVDLVSRQNIKPRVKPNIEKDLVTLYEKR